MSADLSRKVLTCFPTARVEREAWGVYGSTEAEPIAHVAMEHMVERDGEWDGYLVGRPVEEAEVRLLRPHHGPISAMTMDELEALAVHQPGEVGEIAVAGAHVVPHYLDDPLADLTNKIYPEGSEVWHRTGDTGQWDRDGELWLTGRVADLVWHLDRMIEPFTFEQRIDAWPEITRSALVSVDAPYSQGGRLLFLAIIPQEWEQWPELAEDLRAWLDDRGLDLVHPVRLPSLPVDKRHQTKLDRPTLRRFLTLYRHLLGM